MFHNKADLFASLKTSIKEGLHKEEYLLQTQSLSKAMQDIILQYIMDDDETIIYKGLSTQQNKYLISMRLFKQLQQPTHSKVWLVKLIDNFLQDNLLMEQQKNVLLHNKAYLLFEIRAYNKCLQTMKTINDAIDFNLLRSVYLRSGINVNQVLKNQNDKMTLSLIAFQQKIKKDLFFWKLNPSTLKYEEFERTQIQKDYNIEEYFNLGIVLKNIFHRHDLAKIVFQQICTHFKQTPINRLSLFAHLNLIQIFEHSKQFEIAQAIISKVLPNYEQNEPIYKQLAKKKELLLRTIQVKKLDPKLIPFRQSQKPNYIDKDVMVLTQMEKDLDRILKNNPKESLKLDKLEQLKEIKKIVQIQKKRESLTKMNLAYKGIMKANRNKFKEKPRIVDKNLDLLSSFAHVNRRVRFSKLIVNEKTSEALEELDQNLKRKKLVEQDQQQEMIDKMEQRLANCQQPSKKAIYHYKLGELYDRINDKTHASKHYLASLEKGYKESYLKVAIHLEEDENLFTAINYYQKYLNEVKSDDWYAEMRLIQTYSKIPQFFTKALDKLKDITETHEFYYNASLLMINIYCKQKNYEKAIEACEKLKTIYSGNYQIYHTMGLIYKFNENRKKSIESFLQALKINPKSTESVIELCALVKINELHHFDEVISILRKALFQKEKNAQILRLLKAFILGEDKKRDHLRSGIKFSELIEIGDLFLEEGMIDEAEYAYEWAGDLTSNSIVYEKLGDIAYAKGDYHRSEQFYQLVLRKEFLMKLYFKVGNLKLKQGLYEDAITIFTQCQDQDPNSSGIYYSLIANAYFCMEEYEQALVYYGQALRMKYTNKKMEEEIKICNQKLQEESN